MDANEAQTRATRIDQQLAAAGWVVAGTDFVTEYEVGSPDGDGHGFADYQLPDRAGRPLAIVEAKRSSRDVIAGKEQAFRYVHAIKQREGVRPFVFLANGDEIWFWDTSSNPRAVSGFFTQDDLERRRFQRDHQLPLTSSPASQAIANRPYQLEAVSRTHTAWEEGRRRCLWVMATGTGKTRTAAALVKTLLDARAVQRVLFLVDRDALATQALDAFSEHLPGEPRQRIRSSNYDPSKRVYVATLQTMQDFHRAMSPGAFDLVISDECHRSIFNKWATIFDHFDARVLGLTATPADFIDRNTFDFFDCLERTPTFAYEYDQGVLEGHVVAYRVWHARTRFQIEGIHGDQLSPQHRQELIDEGIDPDDIDFAGTDLERRVTNEDTTRLLVEEFIENARTDPDGSLPGKAIVFAMSHAHARRLYEMFLRLFPQWPGVAEIIDSHMEHPDRLLKRFKREDMPRVAISVDMLDTGVDVPSVVNLAFMKPVFSKIKFWQMIGRGTRPVTSDNETSWCPAGSKEHFLILDFWENFEYFNLNPEGEAPTQSTPVPVRFCRLATRVLTQANERGARRVAEEAQRDIRALVDALPLDSHGVRQERALVEQVRQDAWWARLDEMRQRTLIHHVAPLTRYIGGVDLKALAFAARCYELILALWEGDSASVAATGSKIRDDVLRLPRAHPDVTAHADLLDEAASPTWAEGLSVDDVVSIRGQLADLMKYRQRDVAPTVTLNLPDAFRSRRWVTVGPEATEFDLDEYRERVEARVRRLAGTHPAFIKLATEVELTDQDITAIERELHQPELYITEDSLRAAYRAPHGSLVRLLRNALGVEDLPTRREAIEGAIDAFIHNIEARTALSSDQLLFLRLFKQRLLMDGRVERVHLYEDPFTLLRMEPDEVLAEDDLDALLNLAADYGAPYDA